MRFRLFTIALLQILLLLHTSRAQDIYDLAYLDNTSSTLNYLSVNSAQSHMLHESTDVDWFWFVALKDFPYTLRVENVGAGIDPALSVYIDGVNQPPTIVDNGYLGETETYARSSWPTSGIFLARVDLAIMGVGSTDYTLSLSLDTGPNIGLPTISGKLIADLDQNASSWGLGNPSRKGASSDFHYTQHTWHIDAGTFSQPLYGEFGGISADSLFIDFSIPAWVQWHARFPTNHTPLFVRLLETDISPAKPTSLEFQMYAQPVESTIWTNNVTEIPITLLDVPESTSPQSAHAFHWDADRQSWDQLDVPVDVRDEGAFWFATVPIDPSLIKTDYSKTFIAVAFTKTVMTTNSVRMDWNQYP